VPDRLAWYGSVLWEALSDMVPCASSVTVTLPFRVFPSAQRAARLDSKLPPPTRYGGVGAGNQCVEIGTRRARSASHRVRRVWASAHGATFLVGPLSVM